MRIIESPASNDVLCGKDKTFNRNIGNMIYRQLIISTATRYARIKTKPEKMKITASIVHTMIHQHNSRFLKQVMIQESGNDEENGSEYYWQEISTTAARDKTSHALRFCASQMRLQRYQEPQETISTTMNRDEATIMAPVTPPIERRSIRGRVQRKSNRYSPSHNEATTAFASIVKRNPIRHRRTVSSENAAQPSPAIITASSIDPNEYYSPHPHSYYHDNQQYYYPYHERNLYVQYKNESPIPMECSSASLPTFLDSHQSTYTKRSYNATHGKNIHYAAMSPNFVKDHHRSNTKTPAGFGPTPDKCDEDDDDDLDAILREPIHWDDDNVEENDEDEENNDTFEL
jgi:hypothetical protein